MSARRRRRKRLNTASRNDFLNDDYAQSMTIGEQWNRKAKKVHLGGETTTQPTQSPVTKAPATQAAAPGWSSNSSAAYSSGGYKCGLTHKGQNVVFDIGGKRLAGATADNIPWHSASLVLDCTGTTYSSTPKTPGKFITSGSDEFINLNKYMPNPQVIKLDWPDMSAPHLLPLEFWRELFELLPTGLTVACCVGSHGRTGTLMTALTMASGALTVADVAMLHIRSIHCPYAVESYSQIDYLYELEEQARVARIPKVGLGVPLFDGLTVDEAMEYTGVTPSKDKPKDWKPGDPTGKVTATPISGALRSVDTVGSYKTPKYPNITDAELAQYYESIGYME